MFADAVTLSDDRPSLPTLWEFQLLAIVDHQNTKSEIACKQYKPGAQQGVCARLQNYSFSDSAAVQF